MTIQYFTVMESYFVTEENESEKESYWISKSFSKSNCKILFNFSIVRITLESASHDMDNIELNSKIQNPVCDQFRDLQITLDSL